MAHSSLLFVVQPDADSDSDDEKAADVKVSCFFRVGARVRAVAACDLLWAVRALNSIRLRVMLLGCH